jgi:hypothetical protein
MRALVYDPSQADKLTFAERPDPVPASSQALVEVHAGRRVLDLRGGDAR